jgi:hypothetical protein
MEKENIIAFCSKCNVQSILKSVASHTITTPENPLQAQEDPTGTPYYISVYELGVCERCDTVFLVESCYYDIPDAGVSAFQGQEILYPKEKRLILDENIPKGIKRIYSQALGSYSCGLYEPCVIMCRKTLEAICVEFEIKKGDLKSRLLLLEKNGIIDQKLLSWSDELRMIGNDAAHDMNIVIEKVDAQDAIEFLDAIMLYVFLLDKKFQDFKNRRISKNA